MPEPNRNDSKVFDKKVYSVTETTRRLSEFSTTTDSGSLPIYTGKTEICIIVVTVAVAQILATIAIPIYFPILNALSTHFHTSVGNINLTATVYSIFQGTSPLVWGTLSDWLGRRPIYFACIAIFIGSNVGLALAPSYGVLVGMRALQAFGAAPMVTLLGTVIGDISVPQNRGMLMSIASGLGFLGNCFGPMIGGALATYWNWRAVFWFLCILGGTTMLLVFVILPEKHKSYAGNGSVMPLSWINRSPYAYLRHRRLGVPIVPSEQDYRSQWRLPPRKPRLFKWFRILIQADVILVLVPLSINYTTWYMILTLQSTAMAEYYGMSVSAIGYSYLSSGLGTLLGSFLTGYLLQWSYRYEVRRYRAQCDARDETFDISCINHYSARLLLLIPGTAIMIVSSVVFGWCIHFHVSIYCPLVMTFFSSVVAIYYMSATNSLLIDLFPTDSGAATANSNLARCSLCAAGLAVVDLMRQNIGSGITATVLAALCAFSILCILAVLRWGPSISRRRALANEVAVKQ